MRSRLNERDMMIRRLFAIFSALSLLLCMLAIAVFVRSWSVYGSLKRESMNDLNHTFTAMSIGVSSGRLIYVSIDTVLPVGTADERKWSADERKWLASQLGWSREVRDVPRRSFRDIRDDLFECFWRRQHQSTNVFFPFWPVILILSTPPALALARWRRSLKRRAHHHCANCGYDLRATLDRCPECGTVPIGGGA
jgi:hypothetical protein